MSEPKRATFITINDTSKPSTSSPSVPAVSKTIRFDLNLIEPNADSFTEFNYAKLLHIEKVILLLNSDNVNWVYEVRIM